MNPPTARRPGRAARQAAAWLSAYVLVVVAPLLLLLVGAQRAPGRGFPWDFSMALGYAALAMFGVQFLLTARFRRATLPFGIDIVYYFHRYLAACAVAVVLLHVGLIAVAHPEALQPADPRAAPPHMTAGRAALVVLAAVLLAALLRRRLGLEYERWRMAHALLSVAGMLLALWHLLGAAHYLDDGWKQALWTAYGAGWVVVLLYVRLLRPWRILRAPWRVAEVRPENDRVWTLVLEPAAGQRLRFVCGQFAWLTLRSSPFAMREHPFSIASSAARDDRIELSIKALGDFSGTIRDVAPGETAWVDAPYGTFSVDHHPQAQRLVFVAGGIGIAPLMSMLRTLADRGDRRPMLLVYGNRAWERIAFREELEQLSRRLDLRVVHTLLEPPPGWSGACGRITQQLLDRQLPAGGERAGCECFVCGPTGMTQAVEAALAVLGVPADRVHSELFEWV